MIAPKLFAAALVAAVLAGTGCHLRSPYMEQDEDAAAPAEKVEKVSLSTAPPSDYYATRVN